MQITVTQFSEAEFKDFLKDSFRDSVHEVLAETKASDNLEQIPTFNKIPVQEIFKQKFLSKPTFYSHVKEGTFTLYKLGGRSYVDAKEFDNAFKKVQIA